MEEKIKNVLDKVRPYLQNDGGDIVFKRYENGVVYVKLIGACSNCPMAIQTLEDGIEQALAIIRAVVVQQRPDAQHHHQHQQRAVAPEVIEGRVQESHTALKSMLCGR